MNESKFSETIRQGEETLCYVFIFMMSLIYPFFLSEGYAKAGTDKGILYMYLAGAFCIMGTLFAIMYYVCKIKSIPNFSSILKTIHISDWFMLAFLFCIIISYIFSDNKEIAILGEGGWYQGFLPFICLVISYFIISRFLSKKETAIATLALGSTVECLLAIINRFGFYPIKMPNINNNFLGTIGNINWFCGYWSVFFGLAVGLYLKSQAKNIRILSAIILIIISFAGALQGSDSALIVFGVVSIFLLIYPVKKEKLVKQRALETVALIYGPSAIFYIITSLSGYLFYIDSFELSVFSYTPFALIICFIAIVLLSVISYLGEDASIRLFKVLRIVILSFVGIGAICYFVLLIKNTLNPGSIGRLSSNGLFTANYEWGNSRGYTLAAGVLAFKDGTIFQKLFGYGPDSIGYAVYRSGYSTADFIIAKFGEARLTNAHSEWLTTLVNYGLFGLVSFMGMEFSKAKQLLKQNDMIPFSCGICILTYLSNTLFSFSQPLNIPFLFIVMGIGTSCICNPQTKEC